MGEKMSESLQWKIQENGDVTTFFFKGDITEQSRFDLLEKAFEPYQNRSVFINLRFIENMNSSGINKWMKLISFLIDNNIYVEFKECSVEIVLQLNMISNFNGGYAIQ
jgi:hypothetical protein